MSYRKRLAGINKHRQSARNHGGLLNGLDDEEIHAMKKRLISIAADGNIDAEERKDLDAILESLDNLAKTISELRMLAEKFTERG